MLSCFLRVEFTLALQWVAEHMEHYRKLALLPQSYLAQVHDGFQPEEAKSVNTCLSQYLQKRKLALLS